MKTNTRKELLSVPPKSKFGFGNSAVAGEQPKAPPKSTVAIADA